MAALPTKTAQTRDVSRAVNALRRMVRGLRSAAESVDRELSVSAAQLFVLRELASVPDQSVKDLATLTMTTHSTVSQVVGRLISKRLVTRTTDKLDGRRSVLRLTREGAALLRKAPRAVQEDLIDGFALLTASQRRALAIGLEKWLTASGLSGARPAMLFDRPRLPGRKGALRRRK